VVQRRRSSWDLYGSAASWNTWRTLRSGHHVVWLLFYAATTCGRRWHADGGDGAERQAGTACCSVAFVGANARFVRRCRFLACAEPLFARILPAGLRHHHLLSVPTAAPGALPEDLPYGARRTPYPPLPSAMTPLPYCYALLTLCGGCLPDDRALRKLRMRAGGRHDAAGTGTEPLAGGTTFHLSIQPYRRWRRVLRAFVNVARIFPPGMPRGDEAGY